MPAVLRFACAFVLLAAATAASAQTTDCTEITAVPYTISVPGAYCLRKSLGFPAGGGLAAIEVYADDVLLDLNGHVLANLDTSAGTRAWGVYGAGIRNFTLRNGTVRGFFFGVNLQDFAGVSLGNLIEHLLVERTTYIGVVAYGQGSVVRRNRIVRTGGSSVFPDAVGLYAVGPGMHVADNEIVGTVERSGGDAIGISAYAATGAVVERNVVSNAAFGPSRSVGIVVAAGSQQVTIADNRVSNMRTGISTPTGLSSLYLGNTVGGAATAFSGGVMAGTTNYSF